MRQLLRRKQAGIAKPQPRLARDRSLGVGLGLREVPLDALIQEIQAGLSFGTIETLSTETGIPVSEIAFLIDVPERTFARRKVSGKFSREESERLLRLSNAFEQAVGLFEGNSEAALKWLRTPKKALSGKSPLTYLQTEIGARQVEDLMGQLEHGVFA